MRDEARVGNRTEWQQTAALYTNRRRESKGKSTFPIRSGTPDLDLSPLTCIRKILAVEFS